MLILAVLRWLATMSPDALAPAAPVVAAPVVAAPVVAGTAPEPAATSSGGGQTVDGNNSVWMNTTATDNHCISVNVSLPDSPFGIGTRVTDFESGTTQVVGHEELRTDFAYRSTRPALLHFGLGVRTIVDVRLELPGGASTTLTDVAAAAGYRFVCITISSCIAETEG